MRRLILRYSRLMGLFSAGVLLFCFGAAQKTLAQGCGNWMTPEYSTYTNYSSDGTYIYTAVGVSGTTTGNCPFGCDFECNSATHTPHAYNVVGGVGGWQTGSPVVWDYELAQENDQKLQAAVGQQYNFTAETEVVCSVAGVLYVVSEYDFLLIWQTTAKLQSDLGHGTCVTTDDCLGGATPLCGVGDVYDGTPCKSAFDCYGVAYRELTSEPWTCFRYSFCYGTTQVPGPCHPTK
jgi:hypothetical protein